MKKHLTYLLFAILFLPVFQGCRPDSGDGVMDRPDYTMVKYQLTFSDELLKFYDVNVTYTTVDGKTLSETMTNMTWQYKEKSEEAFSNFSLTVTATSKPKDKRPQLGEKVKSVEFTCEYSGEYYSKATSAKRLHRKSLEVTVMKENIDAYLTEHSMINLCDINMNTFKE